MKSPAGDEPQQRVADDQARWRIQVYPAAVLLTLAVAVAFAAFSAGNSSTPGEDIGGDYPAFYGAGKIAADGEWDELYSLDRQISAQDGLYADDQGDIARFFAYPPPVAAIYRPLAALDYHWSYLVHTALMSLLLWAAVLMVRPMIPWVRGKVALAVAAAMLFWPMFRTITGGSNTALTMFLIVAVWRLVHDDRQLAAGLVLGGLIYKPQFVLPLVGLFLLGRYWRVVAGASIGAAVFFLWGVTLRGWGWGSEWVEAAADFGAIDAELNGHSSISSIGFAENLFGVGLSPVVALAWILAGLTALFLSWLWFKGERADLPYLMAITMPGILLLSLHAMSHDGAIIILTAAVAVGAWERSRWVPWVAVVWLLGASQLAIRQLGFSPGFPMLLIVLFWAWLVFDRQDPRPQQLSPAARGSTGPIEYRNDDEIT